MVAGGLEAGRQQIFADDGGGGAVVAADVDERRRLRRLAHRVVVDHQLGDDVVGELVVAGPRLGVDEGEAGVLLQAQVAQMAEAEAEGAHHRLVLGAADEAAVGEGHPLAEGAPQHPAEDRRRGQGVGVGVVVGEHQPAPVAPAARHPLLQLGEALPGQLGDHEGRDCTGGPGGRAGGRRSPYRGRGAAPGSRIGGGSMVRRRVAALAFAAVIASALAGRRSPRRGRGVGRARRRSGYRGLGPRPPPLPAATAVSTTPG